MESRIIKPQDPEHLKANYISKYPKYLSYLLENRELGIQFQDESSQCLPGQLGSAMYLCLSWWHIAGSTASPCSASVPRMPPALLCRATSSFLCSDSSISGTEGSVHTKLSLQKIFGSCEVWDLMDMAWRSWQCCCTWDGQCSPWAAIWEAGKKAWGCTVQPDSSGSTRNRFGRCQEHVSCQKRLSCCLWSRIKQLFLLM